MVGSKNVPPSAWRLPPSATRAALRDGVGDVLLDLGHGLGVDQRTLVGRAREAVAHAQLAHRFDQLRDERVVHAFLHQQAIGADAGLAGVAVLRGDRALHGGVEVGVVEHDERRVAAELQRNLLERAGALLHQLLADLGRAREGELAHPRVRGHLAADRGGGTGDYAEHAFRDAGAVGELGHGERGVGRLHRGLADEGATGGECGTRLARDHRRREVPGRDGRDDADWLAQHDQALVALVAGDDVAVHALAFLGEPFDERGGIGDLALRLGEWLALLGGHQHGEVVDVREHQVVPAPQDRRALLCRAGGPLRKGRGRGLDGATRFRGAHVRHRADDGAGGGVGDVHGAAGVGGDPGTVHIALLAEQGRVGQRDRHGGSHPTWWRKNSMLRSKASCALRASKSARSVQLKPWPAG